ncbi:MAG: aryl-sulfate sulfotransferase [bacterium]|nr:aryl-sulfate sulfotransferase [bacterium]
MPLGWLALVAAALVGVLVLSHRPADAQTLPTISVTCPQRVAAPPHDATAPGAVACTFAVSPQPTAALTIRYEVVATGSRGLDYEQSLVTTATAEQDHIYYLPGTTEISVRLVADAAYSLGTPNQATIAVGTSTAHSGAGLHINEPGALDGYTLLTGVRHNRFYLIDNQGRQAYQWDRNGALGKLLDNGNRLTGHTGADVSEISPDGTYAYNYSATGQHHDVVKLSNGNFLYINSDYYTTAESIDAGANPACLGENGLEVDSIVEIQPTGTNGGDVVWKWNVWDHLVQDHDSTKDNYGVIADHPELIDINYGICQIRDGSNGFIQNPHHLTHLNSIDYNATLNQVLITSRHFSEVWVIDHSTTTQQAATDTGGNSGMGGNLLYRFGNPRTHQNGNKNDQRLFFPHNAHWIPSGLPGAGNILVYNNGHEHPGFMRNYASVDELAFPSSGHAYLRAGDGFMLPTLVWTHRLAERTWILSNAQRLPNGNTLITEGFQARISEVTENGSVVWHYISPLARGTNILPQGGPPDDPGDVWVYRAYKYASNHPGISALTLTPVAERKLLTKPGVSIAAGPAVTEGAAATFTLTVSPLPSAPITVNVSVSSVGGFATAATTTVTIPETGTATLSVDTIGDTTDEPDGSVSATINSGSDYRIASTPTATVDVADDDSTTCTVTPTSDDLIGLVRRYHDANRTRSDYDQNWFRVLIAFGNETSDTLEPFTAAEATAQEAVWDGWEAIRQELERLEAACPEPAPLVENDPVPVVGIAAGGDITEGTDATFTLTASPPPAAALPVTVTVTASGDYGATTGTQTVTIDTNGTGTLTINTTGDTTDEANGTITATLTDGTAYNLDTAATSATVNVADDDDPDGDPVPVVGIAAGGDITEGTDATFTLTASPPPAAALPVTVTVTASGDYGATTGTQTVTIDTNGTGTLTINTTGDTTDEANGTITATLTDGTAYNLDTAATSATVNVADDDDPVPVVTLESASAVFTESTSFTDTSNTDYDYYLVRISIDGPVGHLVSVYFTYRLTGTGVGHAAVDDDFFDPSRQIRIQPGWTRATGLLRIIDDAEREPDETLQLLITDPEGATIGNDQITLTIKDND